MLFVEEETFFFLCLDTNSSPMAKQMPTFGEFSNQPREMSPRSASKTKVLETTFRVWTPYVSSCRFALDIPMRAKTCSNSPLWLLKVEFLNCWPGLQSIKSCTSFLNYSRVLVLCKVPAWSCRCNSVWKSSSSPSSESNSSLSSSSRSSLWSEWGSSSVWKSSLQSWLVLVRVLVTLGLGYRLCFVDVLGYGQN